MNIYGADGVRKGMLLSSPAGNDLLFAESLCEQGRNFNNKIWNAFRLVKGWEVADNLPQPDSARIACEWFDAILSATITELNDDLEKYRISEALMTVFKLFRDEFSSWYLEMVKPAYQMPIDGATYRATLGFFEKLTILLHPFMPFITEEVWQSIAERKDGESIMVVSMPEAGVKNDKLITDFEAVKQIIAGVRSIRLERNIRNRDTLVLNIDSGEYNGDYDDVIMKMCNLERIERAEKDTTSASFMVGTTAFTVPLGSAVDREEEIKKMEEEIKYLEGFLKSVEKKLSNENFIAKADPKVVENERKKQADAQLKIASYKLQVTSYKLPG
jgi:valyl-tRNA synthetase